MAQYYEFITEAGDTMDVTLTRYNNNSNCYAADTTTTINPERSAYWDEALWDVDFWDCQDGTRTPTIEDKFIAETFRYKVSTENTKGALDIVSLIIYGRVER